MREQSAADLLGGSQAERTVEVRTFEGELVGMVGTAIGQQLITAGLARHAGKQIRLEARNPLASELGPTGAAAELERITTTGGHSDMPPIGRATETPLHRKARACWDGSDRMKYCSATALESGRESRDETVRTRR